MNKGYRFQVKRGLDTWLVVDQSKAKIKMHNDVVDTFTSREAARTRCQELNANERAAGTQQQPPLAV